MTWNGGEPGLPSARPSQAPGLVAATANDVVQVRDETGVSRNTAWSFAWPIPSFEIARDAEISRCHSYVSHQCLYLLASLSLATVYGEVQ